MAEPTVQQQPVGRRLGLLVRAVPRIRCKAHVRADLHETEAPGLARPGILSLHLDLAVTDDEDAAATLERVLCALRPGDRVSVVGPPEGAEPRVDDRPFTIWA
ncbi:hypothetical protein [Promicromonospora iranensis]|uniref:Uncharacterized protein n=1 Tax=Promicromonospora iranensis TaxID=1105144 RepID=A0ABU2CQH5_9MICO|nr:hypothetical protein [Promicromonospora iranensis]MDR7383591.1 hypothetical protein [Promicromonospora iranensis]